MRTSGCAITRLRRSAIGLTLAAVLGIIVNTAGLAASSSTEQLRYRVQHSVFGNIGTYTNTVQTIGDITTVQTSVHFVVKMLGVGLHSEDAERTERWQGGRLMSFIGTTKKNGDTLEVKGEASGNEFVIQSPLGTFTAPGTVQPANPWSAKCLHSTTMMRVDNGQIERVRVSGGGETTVAIGGAAILVHEYAIDGAKRYKVWIDQNGTPLKFVVDDDSGEVTFTLEK
jgi:hypothetical protein